MMPYPRFCYKGIDTPYKLEQILGRVVSVGSKVTRFKISDPAGVGCMIDSCQHCAACGQGLEQYCEEFPTFTYNSNDRQGHLPRFGGYSEKTVVSDKFV
jgi:uncharacterized zinc-type alcohol dehydrogenase-like protein